MTAKRLHWSRRLRGLGACREAVEWARTQPSLAVAWDTCERGDWMLWPAYAAAAAYAADAAAGAAAAAAMLRQCADIVREHYPRAPRLPQTRR